MSHQLPAWPGTTITSSSCSSSGIAVRPRRGCQREVGPSPILIVLFLLCRRSAAPSQRPRLFLGFFFTAHCGAFSRDKSGDHCNVHLRHVSVALTGRRWCVRAGCVSRSGRISPSDLQHLSLGYILVLSVAARFDLCSKRGDCCRNNLREPPYFSHLASGYLWLAT